MAWLQAPGRRLKTRRLTQIWFPQRSSSHTPFLWVSRRDGADTRKRLYTRAMNWLKRFVARRAKIRASRAKGVTNRRRLFHFLPDEVVVFAAVEHSDNPAFVVPLKHLFATPNAFSVESVRAKREQFFFGSPRPLAEKSVGFARDGVDHVGRELILTGVFVQFFRADGDRFAFVRDRHDLRGYESPLTVLR